MRPRGRRLSSISLVLCAMLVGWWTVTIAEEGNVDRAPTMPGWGQVLSPQEMWDLVAFLRQLSK